MDWTTADFESAESIQEIPVNVRSMCGFPYFQSFIIEPAAGTVIEDDKIDVRGVAISGGGRGIVRVDISPDGGHTWQTAELIPTGQPYNKYRRICELNLTSRVWAWTHFRCVVPVSEEMRGQHIEICSKAVNSAFDVQPDTATHLWNIRGVLNNAWHRVGIDVANE